MSVLRIAGLDAIVRTQHEDSAFASWPRVKPASAFRLRPIVSKAAYFYSVRAPAGGKQCAGC
jgi:hypothetical protein